MESIKYIPLDLRIIFLSIGLKEYILIMTLVHYLATLFRSDSGNKNKQTKIYVLSGACVRQKL